MIQTKFQNQATSVAARRTSVAAFSAILALLLGWGSAAQARTEMVRWTHSGSDVAGFRLYQSGTPGSAGSVIEDLSLAEVAQNDSGAFFFDVEVEGQQTVYIAITAYSDADVESLRSNERAYAPAVVSDPDRDGDGYVNEIDAFPDDPSEHLDSDFDGVGNNADAFPFDASESVDSDGDGRGDNSDGFPFDPTRFEITIVLSPYRVNAGDTQDRELSDGRTWTRDVGFWNTGIANSIDPDTQVTGTSFDEMYRSSRTDLDSGDEML